MADLVNTNDLIDSLCNRGQQALTFDKDVVMTGAAGELWSSWLGVGRPEAGVAPGAAAVPTSTTTGTLVRFTDPTVGETLRLLKIDAISFNVTSALTLFDRLVHMGGLSGTSVVLQSVNTVPITRGDTGGAQVVGFVECYSTLGVTTRTLSVNYTNAAGTPGRTGSATIPGTMAASRVVPITLQAGDTGIESVEDVTLSGSTGAAGNFGITLARRIMPVGVGVQGQNFVPVIRTGLQAGLPVIEPGACLWMVLRTLAGGGGQHRGGVHLFASG